MAPSGPAPEMVSKLISTSEGSSRRKALELLDDADFGQLSLGRLAVEPAEEFRHGYGVELLRLAHAGHFGIVLLRLGEKHRVAALNQFRAVLGQQAGDLGGAIGRIDGDARRFGGELCERVVKLVDILKASKVGDLLFGLSCDLVPDDEEGRLPAPW